MGRSPRRTGQPAGSLSEAAVPAVMVRSGVNPLLPTSRRYFGQSAALAPTPAADNAAVASAAATIPLMTRGRCCFKLPPEVRQPAVVIDGLPQAIGKCGRRTPTEHPIRLRAVEREAADITGALLTAKRLNAHRHQLADLSKDRVDRDFAAAADVEGLAITGVDGPQVGRRDVADVDVILGLLALPLADGPIALQQGVQERGDDMLAGGDVPGAVDIPIAQDRGRHAGLAAEHADVMLARDLGYPIRTDRVQGLGFRYRLPFHVAVDGPARGGEDDLLTAGP